MNVSQMAWRNIWRNRRRTVVTISAMSLALWVMVLYTGMMQGMLIDMENDILEIEIGDLQIHAPDYRESPSIYTRIEDPVPLLGELRRRGYRASARLLGGGLVASGDSSAGASLRGIDLEADATASEVHLHVAEGSWLAVDDPFGVVIGRRLARSLAVSVGDELVALSQATDGSIANDLLRVRGVLLGVGDATDRTGVFMQASTFREFFSLQAGAHQIVVRRPQTIALDAAEAELRAMAPELEIRTWRQLLPTLASMLDTARAAVLGLSSIVYIVIGILILNAMLMAVFERVREFGVLKALGVSPGKVMRLILTESGMQTGVALASGLAASVPSLWYLSAVGIDTGPLAGTPMMGLAFSSLWKASVGPSTVIAPVAILVLIVSVAVLYPAAKAARISPVEAMRYQ